MQVKSPFENEHIVRRYEAWFARNSLTYMSELAAVKDLLPESGTGLEIGIGTGKFSLPLGIRTGVEPARAMAQKARNSGLTVFNGVAENVPFDDNSFNFALMVTTICFVDDPIRAFSEASRVIRKNGLLLVGFVDRDSTLGRTYEQKKQNHAFYHAATFYSTDELLEYLRVAGFNDFAFRQTLFSDNPGNETAVEAVLPGYGSGAFVVISAR